MTALLGLGSLVGLSLFYAHLLKRSSALMPILSVATCTVWFTVFGCLGLLAVGGWLWYALCLAGVVYTAMREKKGFVGLFSTGLVLFAAAGALLVVLYHATQPMLTSWDEFTFWGTAGKTVAETGQLYTTARGNLIARTYPPGLIVFSYAMQFFGRGFSEPAFIASFGFVYFAAFAAATALWKKNRAGAVLAFATLCLLPFFFEPGIARGEIAWSYLSCMADLPLAALFCGGLCFYFSGGEKNTGLLLGLGVILAALTNLKDIGLALALVAWMVVVADLVFCERDRLTFLRLKRWKGLLAGGAVCLLCILGIYALWALHLHFALAVDRFDVGAGGQSMGQVEMLVAGVKALFGVETTAQYQTVAREMLRAFWARPVSLLGSGLRVLALILVLAVIAWFMGTTGRARRRVLLFTTAMALGFVVFYIFNIFTYSFIFAEVEAQVLKDYERYIFPYWFGWLGGTLVLLYDAACTAGVSARRMPRSQTARVVAAGMALCFVLLVAFRGNWQANFLRISPTQYTQRESVREVLAIARGEGMAEEDVVYIISQGDDGTRFYMMGFEMEALRVPLYAGQQLDENGRPVLGEEGGPEFLGNAAAALVAPGTEETAYDYPVPCTAQQLADYLLSMECTHVLIDEPDEYVVEELGELFADGLASWQEGTGHRYYRIEQQSGEVVLVPEGGERP